tara:strand:+ start:325 stop:444 length:120 start_codon:yes stop_codon:yes gene_type:complete
VQIRVKKQRCFHQLWKKEEPADREEEKIGRSAQILGNNP